MRKVARKSLITVAAASSVLAVTGGYAYADADANGVAKNSPGVGSGNSVQVPVHVPLNVCGNTVNVVGLLNPAAGNSCANVSRGNGGGGSGSSAQGGASNSPGVIAGNSVQVPVEVPVNACGNSIGAGAGNAVTGNKCANASDDNPDEPGNPEEPSNPSEPDDEDKPNPGKPGDEGGSEVKPSTEHKPQGSAVKGTEELAETGAGTLAATGAASAAMLLGGVVLYRRARAASRS
ncbi:chaplin [Streptomyces sp. NPDC048639]|uniref:chaplin n=1 Tax=Streptomyces sp. NPDC048639 TaxID=3365581 RepID=UPI0037244C31